MYALKNYAINSAVSYIIYYLFPRAFNESFHNTGVAHCHKKVAYP
jgi:hypothetical protein